MNRRRFVGQAAGALTLWWLGGLPRALAQSVEDVTDTRANATARGIGGSELERARLAMRVFREARARNRLPVDIYLHGHAQGILHDLDSFGARMTDVELVYIGERLHELVRIYAGALDCTARSARRHEPIHDAAQVVVPAFGVTRVVMDGYCLDSGLPAPGVEDKIRLVQAARYYDADIAKVIQDVLRYSARNRIDKTQIQHILWGLRELPYESDYARSLGQRQDLLAIIERSSPGASHEIQERLRKLARERARREALARFLNLVLGPGGIHTAIPALRELLDPSSSRQGIERHLASLNRPVEGVYRDYAEAPYAELSGGVYSETKGLGHLAVGGLIINLTPKDFTFEPAAWVGEPAKPQQRVAFDRASARIIPAETDTGDFSLQAFGQDVGEFFGQKLLGMNIHQHKRWWLVESIINKYRVAKGLLDQNGVVKKALIEAEKGLIEALKFTPLLGNAWSLYEAFDPESTPAERVIDLLGAIPGYGALATAAGSATRLGRVAANALDAAPHLAKAIDRSSLLRDIAEIGAIDLTQDDMKVWSLTYQAAQILVHEFS